MSVYKDIGRKLILGAGLALMSYSGPLTALNMKGLCFSERIENQAHLKQVIAEERGKLRIDSDVRGELNDTLTEAYCWKESMSDGNGGKSIYKISLGKIPRMRDAVRHELYHIKRGDCDREAPITGFNAPILGFVPTDLYYLFIAEPRAILYQSLGLEL